MSLEKLQDSIGKTKIVEDFVSPWPVRALIATLDESDPDPEIGEPLPPLWHWLYFLEAIRASEIGPDGHPERDDFLPSVPLPRRMWAGGRISFDGEPLRIGDKISRRSTITSVRAKSGSSGGMVFVTIQDLICGPRGMAITEDYDIVYLEAAKPGERPRPAGPAPTDATWLRKIVPDEVLLFRFSALIFNSHRIHYDRPYATGTEGYPELIVQGPLMGLLQMELARRANPSGVPSSFEFRALSPAFAGTPLTVGARTEADGAVTTWIANAQGGLAQQGTAIFR
jgi:3-methylfumaryl-CoA hydratase